MHPLLESRRRLGAYLLAWVPIAGLLAVLVWASGGAKPLDAGAEVGSASMIYAFVCLSPWYICRVRPLRVADAPQLALTFVSAALIAGLGLAGLARLAAGMLDRPLSQWVPLAGMGALLYLVSVGLHYAALAAESSRKAEQREAEARALAREAELLAIRAQLNPHFLFNSLHSISALAVQDGARAREMCIRLADFLRSSLGMGHRESIPLSEELVLARSYLGVEQVRFGARLRVEESIDESCLDCAVPALLLQPLVENAVKHGIAGLVEGGTIRVVAARTALGLSLRIENAFDPENSPARSLGMGQVHVRRRLEVRYGGRAGFEAGADDAVYRVDLRLPCESPMASSNLV
jgi:two-component system, LytTR family, sensor histidine kinase AlgZ